MVKESRCKESLEKVVKNVNKFDGDLAKWKKNIQSSDVFVTSIEQECQIVRLNSIINKYMIIIKPSITIIIFVLICKII